jgi:hypothetical protein
MKRMLVAFSAALCAAAVQGQQTIDLYGKITNASGAAVAGAEVKLRKTNLSTVSGNDGIYRLRRGADVSRPWQMEARKTVCTVRGNILTVTAPAAGRVSAALFDIQGRRLWGTAGVSRTVVLPLGGLAEQTGFLRVKAGSDVHRFSFIRCGGAAAFAAVTDGEQVYAQPLPAAARLPAGTLPILDTLVTTGTGFSTYGSIRI